MPETVKEDCLNLFAQKTACGDNAIGGTLTVGSCFLHFNEQRVYSCVKTVSEGEQLPPRVMDNLSALQAQ